MYEIDSKILLLKMRTKLKAFKVFVIFGNRELLGHE